MRLVLPERAHVKDRVPTWSLSLQLKQYGLKRPFLSYRTRLFTFQFVIRLTGVPEPCFALFSNPSLLMYRVLRSGLLRVAQLAFAPWRFPCKFLSRHSRELPYDIRYLMTSCGRKH